MGVVYFLLPASIILAIIGLSGFLWAVRKGQYDELDTPSLRMLLDDRPLKKKEDSDSLNA